MFGVVTTVNFIRQALDEEEVGGYSAFSLMRQVQEKAAWEIWVPGLRNTRAI